MYVISETGSCDRPPAVADSTFVSSNSANTDLVTFSINEELTYSCKTDYYIASGNQKRTCQEDKTWSGSAPVCGMYTCVKQGSL